MFVAYDKNKDKDKFIKFITFIIAAFNIYKETPVDEKEEIKQKIVEFVKKTLNIADLTEKDEIKKKLGEQINNNAIIKFVKEKFIIDNINIDNINEIKYNKLSDQEKRDLKQKLERQFEKEKETKINKLKYQIFEIVKNIFDIDIVL